ncbi:hypothetical protein F4777DRAFT_601255 [Nemania sp. FL0916]|nr:hypothetical protein F4777DRAFT_601255 [Nemania sp. FL0916]
MAIPGSTNIIIVSSVLTGLALIFVLLRLRARRKQHVPYLADDYLTVLSMFLAAARGQLGNHIMRNSNGAIQYDAKSMLILTEELSFWGNIPRALAKLSVLYFYRRIFQGKIFSIVSLVLIIITSIWGASFFFATLFTCYPIHYAWTSTNGQPEFEAHCFNPVPLFYANAVSNMILDIFILLIPGSMVWPLVMPTKQKIAVIGIFALGGFVVAITAIRVVVFVQTGPTVQTDPDITYNLTGVTLWSYIEACVSIICACLPTLQIIFVDSSLKREFHRLATKIPIFPNGKKSLLGSQSNLSEPSMPLRDKKSILSLPNVLRSGEQIRLHSIEVPEVPETLERNIVMPSTNAHSTV